MRSLPARSTTSRLLATTRCFWSASQLRLPVLLAGGSPPEPSERLATEGESDFRASRTRDEAGSASSRKSGNRLTDRLLPRRQGRMGASEEPVEMSGLVSGTINIDWMRD